MNETPQQAARRLAAAAIRDGYEPEALHVYTDKDGNPLHWRIRLKRPGMGEKWIRPMKLNGEGYVLGEPQYPSGKPLYRLHEMASRPDAPLIVVEGEWCADALARVGVLATTSGAADSAGKADWKPLAGRRVLIWPDNDESGQRYTSTVGDTLLALSCTVRFVDVAVLNLPPKGDAVDWLRANPQATEADIFALPTIEPPKPSTENQTGVSLIHASNLKPEPIRWLWDGWLACGKLHVLAGAPGTGKTTIALALAATVTIGGRWPDGSRCEPGSVLVWSGEDDPTDTLLPRLLAAGADPARVFFVGDVRADDEIRSFDPARDMQALQIEAARVGDVRLMIIDPVVNAVAGDSHKNGEVRRALQPLVELSTKLDVAALGISHFSKGTAGRDPVERVTGSIAFGALPRVVMATAKIEGDDGKQGRLFARAKSNIGPDGGGFDYTIEQIELVGHSGLFASRVLWGDPLDGSARDLLAVADTVANPEEHGALTETADWLHGLLNDEGEMDKREIMKLARADRFAERTIQRARVKLGIQIRTSGFGREKRSYWRLPENPIRANRAKDSMAQEPGTNGTNEGDDPENARERLEERVAIMEFDGGLSRDDAEREAQALASNRYRPH